MGRTYARIRVDIWRDTDWRSLTRDAQWLYELMLTQQRISMAGSLDLKPSLWAQYAADADADDIDKALVELERAGLIATDHSTAEVVVRTFVVHDDVLRNQNLGRAMWSAWASIESVTLRQCVVDNVPPDAWDLKHQAPIEARRMRHGEHSPEHS